jgi:hypothetical protein
MIKDVIMRDIAAYGAGAGAGLMGGDDGYETRAAHSAVIME